MRTWTRLTVLSGAALLVVGAGLSPWQRWLPAPDHMRSWLSQLLVALSFGFVGAAVAERAWPPGHRVGWVLMVTGWCQAATFATSAVVFRPGAAPAAVVWVDAWLWVPAVVAVFVVLPLVFPDGRPSRGWHGLGLIALGVSALAVLAAAYDALPGQALSTALAVLVLVLGRARAWSEWCRWSSGSAGVRSASASRCGGCCGRCWCWWRSSW